LEKKMTVKNSQGLFLAMFIGAALALTAPIRADILVSNYGTNTVRRYTDAGGLISSNFITFAEPTGIAVSGTNVFVASDLTGTINLYNTSGALITANLITGLSHPHDLIISGDSLYVADSSNSRIGKYSISGNSYNANFVTGFPGAPTGLAISGTTLVVTSGTATTTAAAGEYNAGTGATIIYPFVPASGNNGIGGATIVGNNLYFLNAASTPNSRISEYDLLGNPINTNLVTNLNNAWGLTNDGSNLFETNLFGNNVGKYGSDGSIISANFITGLNEPTGIAFTPEPTSLSLLALGAGLLARRRVRKQN
jgi:hypothetical protein